MGDDDAEAEDSDGHTAHRRPTPGPLRRGLENWVRLQDEYDCFFLIADYKALGDHLDDIDGIRRSVLEVTLDWLAVGLDPQRSTFVVQSYIPEHAELTMLLSMLTPLGMLQRNPTLKAEMKELDTGTRCWRAPATLKPQQRRPCLKCGISCASANM